MDNKDRSKNKELKFNYENTNESYDSRYNSPTS